MDRLPMDVIQYVIAPLCDYETRVHLICSLPPIDRYSVPLNKDACIAHDLFVCKEDLCNRLYIITNNLENHPIKRYNKIVELLELFNNARYFNLILYYEKVREAFLSKMLEISDDTVKTKYIGKKRIERLKIVSLTLFEKANNCKSIVVSAKGMPFIHKPTPLIISNKMPVLRPRVRRKPFIP